MAPELPLLPVLLTLACTLLGVLATQEMQQTPPYVIAPEGGSASITCCSRGPLLGVYLKQRWPEPSNVIYYEDNVQPTVDERFRGRIVFSGRQHNLTVIMHRLRPADAGAYACQAVMSDEVWGPGTLVVVTGRGHAFPRPHAPRLLGRPGSTWGQGQVWGPLLYTCLSCSFQCESTASRKVPTCTPEPPVSPKASHKTHHLPSAPLLLHRQTVPSSGHKPGGLADALGRSRGPGRGLLLHRVGAGGNVRAAEDTDQEALLPEG